MDRVTFLSILKERIDKAKQDGKVPTIPVSDKMLQLRETLEKAKAEGEIKTMRSNPLLDKIKELKLNKAK